MRRSSSNVYTVLIARTGQLPITLLVRPGALLIVVAIVTLSPIAWLGNRVYSLHRQNQELEAKNQVLSQAANDVFREIEVLDAEIDTLRERAGLPEERSITDTESIEDTTDTPSPGTNQDFRFNTAPPQGGVSSSLEPAEAFEQARGLLPELTSDLEQQVKPALTETLAEEFAATNAVPSVRPVKADLDISSKFGLRRNPFGWGYEMHNGIDFPGPVGTPIYATAPGNVTTAEWGRGYGYHVVVDHGYGYETLYAHLSELKVSNGDNVDRNDIVGLLGNTGRSTGAHLHYSVYKDDKLVDPEDYLD